MKRKTQTDWGKSWIIFVCMILISLNLTGCAQIDMLRTHIGSSGNAEITSSEPVGPGESENAVDKTAKKGKTEKAVNKTAEKGKTEKAVTKTAKKEDSDGAEHQPNAVVLFASDYQHRDGWKDPPDTLSGILDAVYNAGIHPDNAILCGDYTTEHGHNNYNADPHSSVEQIKRIFESKDENWASEDMIFIQGNHDQMTADLSESGLYDFDDYLVYVLNTESEFPWRQGKRNLKDDVTEGANRLQQCLEKLERQAETRPILIAGHVPIHFSGRTTSFQGTGDNLYSAILFDVINQSGKNLNLVYLYGHNHSRGWDSYLGGSCVFRAPGEWLLIPRPEDGDRVTSSYTKETISFTYLNAGYVGYFSSAGGEDSLTCTICEIYQDHLTFSRYSEDGLHLLSAEGKPNPAKDDRALIPQKYYGEELDSPQDVYLIQNRQLQLPDSQRQKTGRD